MWKILGYLGAGIVGGVLVQNGSQIPGILPLSAPGFWLNLGIWPINFVSGALGAPVYLQAQPPTTNSMANQTISNISQVISLPAIQNMHWD
jgi:hypothetical protein